MNETLAWVIKPSVAADPNQAASRYREVAATKAASSETCHGVGARTTTARHEHLPAGRWKLRPPREPLQGVVSVATMAEKVFPLPPTNAGGSATAHALAGGEGPRTGAGRAAGLSGQGGQGRKPPGGLSSRQREDGHAGEAARGRGSRLGSRGRSWGLMAAPVVAVVGRKRGVGRPRLGCRLASESVNARSVVRIVEQGRTHRRVRLAEGGNEGRHSPLGVAAVMARYEARDSLQFSSFACRYLFI